MEIIGQWRKSIELFKEKAKIYEKKQKKSKYSIVFLFYLGYIYNVVKEVIISGESV